MTKEGERERERERERDKELWMQFVKTLLQDFTFVVAVEKRSSPESNLKSSQLSWIREIPRQIAERAD